jgi:hypothetical protein
MFEGDGNEVTVENTGEKTLDFIFLEGKPFNVIVFFCDEVMDSHII